MLSQQYEKHCNSRFVLCCCNITGAVYNVDVILSLEVAIMLYFNIDFLYGYNIV